MGQSSSSVAHRGPPHRSGRSLDDRNDSIEPILSSQTFPLPKPPDRHAQAGGQISPEAGTQAGTQAGSQLGTAYAPSYGTRHGTHYGTSSSRSMLTPPRESGFSTAIGSSATAATPPTASRRIPIPRPSVLAPDAASRRMHTPQSDLPTAAMLQDPCTTETSPRSLPGSLDAQSLHSHSRPHSESLSRALRRLTTWLRPGSPRSEPAWAHGRAESTPTSTQGPAQGPAQGLAEGPAHARAGPEGPVVSESRTAAQTNDRTAAYVAEPAEPPRYGEWHDAPEWHTGRGRRNRSLPFLDFDSDSDSDTEWRSFSRQGRSRRSSDSPSSPSDPLSRNPLSRDPLNLSDRLSLHRHHDSHGTGRDRDSRDQAAVLGRLLAIAASITASSMFGARATDGVHHRSGPGASAVLAARDNANTRDADTHEDADGDADIHEDADTREYADTHEDSHADVEPDVDDFADEGDADGADADEADEEDAGDGQDPRQPPGESFVAFLDSLLNGAYARELWGALFGAPQQPGERPAFFRMFRFPVDNNGLVPVLIVSMRQAEPRDVEEHDHVDIDGGFFRSSPMHGSRHGSADAAVSPTQSPTFHSRQSSRSDSAAAHEFGPGSRPGSRLGSRSGDSRPESRQSWIIVVFGGAFPADHPLFLAPSLLDENPTYEDLLVVEELLGQHKPPVASQQDLDLAGGVFTLDAASPLAKERCPVCLVDYLEGDQCRKLTCEHTFHAECVDAWLRKGQNSCPMCRELGVPKSVPS